MRQSELRLRALLVELEECREALREAVDDAARRRQQRRARRRRVATTLGFAAVFAAGLAVGGVPGLGASTNGSAGSSCGHGAGDKHTVTGKFPHAPGCRTTTGTTSTATTGTTTTATTGTATTGTTTTATTGTATTGTTTTATTSTATTSTATTGTTTTATTSATTTQSATTAPAPSTTTAPLVVPSVADVAVTKVADRSVATVGQQVTYTLMVANDGPGIAFDVALVDPLPAQETLVSVSDAACTGSAVIVCSFGPLGAGTSHRISVVTLAQSPGTATNVATVSTTSPESGTANNQAQATVTIRGVFKPPPLCAKFSLRHSTLIAGRETTLLVHVRSRGTAVAGARVEVRGPGILVVRKTDARGRARFTVKPHRVGVLRVRLLQTQSCPRALTEVPVPGAFLPPLLTG